jgi:hypothetical protein
MNRTMVLLAALAFLIPTPRARAEEDVVVRAMRDELGRSVEKLRLEQLDKPYFISYAIQERSTVNASATFGGLLDSSEQRGRSLTVEVRAGEPALDNTGYFSPYQRPSGVVRMYGGMLTVPLDDDYNEMRRQIWLATDAAYKKALEDLSKKRAYLQNKTRSDDAPDFTHEQVQTTTDTPPPVALMPAAAAAWVRPLSLLFREMPDVATGNVRIEAVNVLTRYVNSEGTSFTRLLPLVSCVATAATQATDGTLLEDFVAAYGRSLADLPSRESLGAQVREMGARLTERRQAPVLDRYNGPVLFEGQAAAEVVAQVLAPRLLATRPPVVDEPRLEGMVSALENPFVDRLDARILPEFLSVSDNPLLTTQAGFPPVGGYLVDDEGVRARETLLIESGYLKTLLSTRTGVRTIRSSSGSRRGAGPQPTNLVMTSTKGLAKGELRQELLKLLARRNKPFGVVVRRVGNPSLRANRDPMALYSMLGGPPNVTRVEDGLVAFKVFPDGREELLRGVEIAGLGPEAFKDIVAVSQVRAPYSAPFRLASSRISLMTTGMMGGDTVVSLVTPSLLFEEVNLKKPSGDIPSPPVARHPFFDR